MLDIDTAWQDFCDGDFETKCTNFDENSNGDTPKCSPIYISTKTKISYLNTEINLDNLFWKLKIIPYHLPCEGIIKKQMKFNTASEEELDKLRKKLDFKNNYVDEFIITQIINPTGRIKFKDVRKISIGLSKKDITSYRCKKKSAFYNCFVVILRILDAGIYKEIHVKVFNTGKLEIPGIQDDNVLIKVLNLLTKNLNEISCNEQEINYVKNKSETVLINSNFSCGYFINREKLFNILKYEYKLNSAFDPCSYPGIQCEFYYDKNISVKEQTGRQTINNNNNITKVSFMIFRTGSVLIVGKCSEEILENIYNFLKDLLSKEYKNVGAKIINSENDKIQKNKRKIRKKIVININ